MFSDVNNDLLIRSLEDRIEKWERCADGSLLVRPKKADFDELAIIFRRIFMDREYNFIATISLVRDPEAKNEALRKLEGCGNLSFELMWKKSFPTRKPVFVRSTKPQPDRKTSKLGSELEASLNSQGELMTKIQKLKPEELSITLVPLGNLDQSRIMKDRSGFQPPPNQSLTQVSWAISLSKILYRSVDYSNKARTIFDILDDLSGLLKKISGRGS